MTAWFHACEHTPPAAVEEVRLGLSRSGIDVSSPDPWPPRGPGVVLFAGADDGLFRLIRSASAGEHRGVIAVSCAGIEKARFHPWELLEAGAVDVLQWTGDECASEIVARLKKRELIREYLSSPLVRENLIGCSPVWNRALEQLVEAAIFSREAILLTGESGTGKELAARLIHALDRRPGKKDLVVVDCTTLMPELAGSELFGHERGAYTGAVTARAGAIQMAHEGTLFLDEIGDLGMTLQAQLLRVIQERTYKRVGGNTWHKADFRLVSATNRDLRAMVDQGAFRRDLYYRIASLPVNLPPLRERREDVIPLARHFVRKIRGEAGEAIVDPALEEYLVAREYPGNVRDLRQLVARIMNRHCGTRWISAASLPEQERPERGERLAVWPDEGFVQSVRRAVVRGVGLQEIAHEAKEAAVHAALDLGEGSVKRAAEQLGVTERAVQMRRAKSPPSPVDQMSRAEST